MKISVKIPVLLVLLFTAFTRANGASAVTDLRTCDMVAPIAVERPVFSWKTLSDKRGFHQSAYEIEVAESPADLRHETTLVWKSGQVCSDAQHGITMPSEKLTYGRPYYWRVRVRDEKQAYSPWSEPARFAIGPATRDWKAEWITADWETSRSAPFFRKEFVAEQDGKEPVYAVAYVCGLGCADLYVNGELLNPERILDPAQTNYEQYAFYSAFDITASVGAGRNSIGVLLGDGWYNQGTVWGPGFSYGKPILRLQAELYYADGTKRTICTDTSWEWTDSPLIRSNIYAGEVYDARALSGFLRRQHTEEGWHRALAASGVIPTELYPQLIEPIRLQEEYAATALRQDPAGNWIFDFGVNIAGIPRIRVTQPEGTHLKMRTGEHLNPDGSIDFSTTGVGATGVVQTEEYICSGNGTEIWSPRFTYHGFRYLELSGAASRPDTSWIKAVAVHTDVRRTGTFRCSNAVMNRLHEMAVRTLASNLHGIPTDCPHREKCGWLGDAHAMFPFANCNFGMYNFWMKYMEDIASTSSTFIPNALHQKLHNSEFYHADKQPGIPLMIAPGRRLCGVASPDWGTAVVQLPWLTYLYYGSQEPLRRHYETMKQWVAHVESIGVDRITPFGLGDWCPPGGNKEIDCPIELSSTAFHYIDISIMERVAKLLGKTDDEAHFAKIGKETAAAFHKKFFDSQTGDYGSHTANAMALDAGLVPAGLEKSVSDAIVRQSNARYDGFIHTGIFGLGRIFQALSRHGNARAAAAMFDKAGENSFSYMWDAADATTLWEILPINAHSRQVGLQSSLNHPMQAVFDAWFYEDVAGIRPDPENPGYKRILFAPRMTAFLKWAEASIETPFGKASSSWKNDGERLDWEIEIPANASGLVSIPAAGQIRIDGRPVAKCAYARETNDGYELPSGKYRITIHTPSKTVRK